MRLLLLTLLAALAPLSWGEDDNPFPVDLTCEVGANVFHLYLTGDRQTSWVKPVFAASVQPIFNKKHLGKKHLKVRSVANGSDMLFIQLPINRTLDAFFEMELNRYNLKLSLGPRGVEGQCILGFKDYVQRLL